MSNTPLVISYSVGDGYTFTAEIVVPVMAESKEAFLDAFDTAMAAYEPHGNEYFSIFGQTFEYRHFIHWSEEQITKRRVRETYDSFPPTIQTVDEWLLASQSQSKRLMNERHGQIFTVSTEASPGVQKI
ncbi:hypothetical protein [Rhizobium sp. MHM7A]|uniref:hypothetical protein n=1 Tax=Rhizobium sp. MHM7A TaxID=2583233 RepID=UPI0011064F32|nr:hypothetical protein [Rhizobium sp. MHM7A]TLX16613.1 hypothetical protein FFR93_04535 [Rhizobium sp. MHM7A]